MVKSAPSTIVDPHPFDPSASDVSKGTSKPITAELSANSEPEMSRRTSESNTQSRFAPTMRRISYQFDVPMGEVSELPPTHTVAFEKQNDHDLQAECDAFIEQAIRDAWTNAGFGRFRHLRVEVHSGHVTLYGRLNSFYYKQMAHSLIRNVHGVRNIENEIQVDK